MDAEVSLGAVANGTVNEDQSPADIPADPADQPVSLGDLPIKVSVSTVAGATSMVAS